MTIVNRGRRVTLHLPVRLRVSDPPSSTVERTRSVNVSGGGICFESRQRLEIGARLEIAIELPRELRRHFGNRAIYRARAVVCRVESLPDRPVAKVGARFLGEIAASAAMV
ncbi:MAG TPA: PilZ domain-containing protein [Vicinamibacteria bacterium]|nr:PilZ domain-containing protein [Vicinamibacteria bacterium]